MEVFIAHELLRPSGCQMNDDAKTLEVMQKNKLSQQLSMLSSGPLVGEGVPIQC